MYLKFSMYAFIDLNNGSYRKLKDFEKHKIVPEVDPEVEGNT